MDKKSLSFACLFTSAAALAADKGNGQPGPHFDQEKQELDERIKRLEDEKAKLNQKK